ncbi:protein phosphatase 2C domain-containing protein [Microbacterium betulae]|uniref:Protein phosphatase 2C domain-containing protein n=1 Tax=Microbacterium betulae TaxID=2981139 RepID=A0AA97I413_9MICO|nr:protein phosphatase 2C domain-containing protein [Microbacterium sp. AB]WOF22096.1 protein phosphatase 2C domain-containing protein [Microbacterium sp. AB]
MPDAPLTTQTRTVRRSGGDVTVSWAAVTDRGRKREVNQDAVLAQFPLFVVADGMGGHIGGEIASASTVERLQAMVDHGAVSPDGIEEALLRAVGDIGDHPETTDEGTGTTVTGIYLDASGDEDAWVVLNIGDSRVYIDRDDALEQVTVDHSLVQELVASGRLSPEEAENHPYGNVITRAVGPSESVVPDYVRIDVRAGDRFVICSDGLTKELTDFGILHFLRQNADPAAAIDAMLEAAIENGGRDNISIIVVDVAEAGADSATRQLPVVEGADAASPGPQPA